MIIIILPDRSSSSINSRGRDPRVLPRKVCTPFTVHTKGTNSHYFITIIEMYVRASVVRVKRSKIELPKQNFLQGVSLVAISKPYLFTFSCKLWSVSCIFNNIGGHPSNRDKLKYSSWGVIFEGIDREKKWCVYFWIWFLAGENHLIDNWWSWVQCLCFAFLEESQTTFGWLGSTFLDRKAPINKLSWANKWVKMSEVIELPATLNIEKVKYQWEGILECSWFLDIPQLFLTDPGFTFKGSTDFSTHMN